MSVSVLCADADDAHGSVELRIQFIALIGRAVVRHLDDVDGTDCVAVAKGWNSITPMHLDLTDRGRVAKPPWSLEGFTVMVGSSG